MSAVSLFYQQHEEALGDEPLFEVFYGAREPKAPTRLTSASQHTRDCALLGLSACPDTESQVARCRSAGFTTSTVRSRKDCTESLASGNASRTLAGYSAAFVMSTS